MSKWRLTILVSILGTLGIISSLILKSNTTPSEKPVKAVNRIVSVAPDITEILFEIGLGDKVIAVTDDSDFPEQVRKLKKIGTFWQPNTEAIIACKPDLVIMQTFEQHKSVAQTLNRLNTTVLSLDYQKLDDLYTAIYKIGRATDKEQQSANLADTIKNKINLIQETCKKSKQIKVLWVVQQEPLRVVGRKTFISEVLELAGGENAIGETLQQYPPISTEELLSCGAEVIIQSAMINKDIGQQQKAADIYWAKYSNIPAVKNRKVYVINSDALLRLGPRLPDGIKILTEYIHK